MPIPPDRLFPQVSLLANHTHQRRGTRINYSPPPTEGHAAPDSADHSFIRIIDDADESFVSTVPEDVSPPPPATTTTTTHRHHTRSRASTFCGGNRSSSAPGNQAVAEWLSGDLDSPARDNTRRRQDPPQHDAALVHTKVNNQNMTNCSIVYNHYGAPPPPPSSSAPTGGLVPTRNKTTPSPADMSPSIVDPSSYAHIDPATLRDNILGITDDEWHVLLYAVGKSSLEVYSDEAKLGRMRQAAVHVYFYARGEQCDGEYGAASMLLERFFCAPGGGMLPFDVLVKVWLRAVGLACEVVGKRGYVECYEEVEVGGEGEDGDDDDDPEENEDEEGGDYSEEQDEGNDQSEDGMEDDGMEDSEDGEEDCREEDEESAMGQEEGWFNEDDEQDGEHAGEEAE
ncbi:hypothetical protein DFH27DRAFT_639858 [Peziza echinospora]|nr:hypothetical protein DFH27DRAFT_639858 [Peziza echinospora]